MTNDAALHDSAQRLAAELIELRRRLHRSPEIGLDLPRTRQAVLDALAGLPLETRTGRDTSSLTAVLRGADSGRAVLLRADMDALPLVEQSGEPFSSEVADAMHACGHDLHTAMLVGAARLLCAHRDQLAGDVVLMFQAGEEGWDGAGRMLADGVLDASGRRAGAAYALHVSATHPRGVFTTRPGPVMSAASGLRVTVRGRGGHGAMPHLANDPITVAAQLVGDLQTLITRRFDVFDPVVLTVGSFHGGTVANVIPDEATFLATVRTFSTEAQARAEQEFVRLCEHVAAGYGVEVDAEYVREYPPTINDSVEAEFAADVVTDVFGPARFERMAAPHPASEDFSRVLAEVPGCYLLLGARVDHAGAPVPQNHSPRVRFDDSVVADGALLHAQLALRSLRRAAGGSVT